MRIAELKKMKTEYSTQHAVYEICLVTIFAKQKCVPWCLNELTPTNRHQQQTSHTANRYNQYTLKNILNIFLASMRLTIALLSCNSVKKENKNLAISPEDRILL